MPVTHQARVSRRSFVTASAATAVLLAACAAPASRPADDPPAAEPAKPQAVQPPVSSGAGPQIAPAPAVQAPPQQPAAPTASPTAPLLNAVAPSPVVNQATPAATATAVPPTAVPTPTPKTYDAARLTDRLGSAQTSYAGSIPERAWNVELAAKRLDGVTVPPGGIFSFNQAVGPTTLKAGFRIGYGIANGKDGIPETVPSVAGGICQIATTVFQAAFWAGFPFVERHYHLYWIPRYGAPPTGRTGFDATVDDPGVDLKFKNTTDDWIRLNSWFDGANVGFVIRGVDPGWKVEASTPRIYDVVKTNPEVVRQEDPTMPAGRELDVEHAEDGFKVTVRRLVTLNGKTVDEYVFTNNYKPSRNVVLVGTKGATPTPTATVAPVTTPTPAVPPTATPVKAPAKLPDGKILVPSLVGLPEAQARKLIEQAGLNNTYTNYQGPGQVPPEALKAVEVGSVLSQQPAPGSPAAPGTTVHIAVRKA